MADVPLITESPPLVDPAKADQKEREPERKPARRTSSRPRKAEQLEGLRDQLTAQWVMIGGAASMAGLPLTGRAMIYQASDLTDSLITWGKSSPRVAKALLSAGKGMGFLGFAGAFAPIGISALTELRVIRSDMAKLLLPEELHEFLPKYSVPGDGVRMESGDPEIASDRP